MAGRRRGMGSGDKFNAIFIVAFLGFCASMVTPWALLATATGIAAIAFAPKEDADD
jgi:hypothetical protein